MEDLNRLPIKMTDSQMIDMKLRAKAVNTNTAILEIDNNWRAYIRRYEETEFTLPFTGEYNAIIKDKYILIEGYCGRLLINKIYGRHNMYIMLNPIVVEDFKLYGVFNNSKQFQQFVSIPTIGAHYYGITTSVDMKSICVGDLRYEDIKSLDRLKDSCQQLIQALEVINLESLGDVHLPEEYEKLSEILNLPLSNTPDKIDVLLKNKIMKTILKE